MKWMHLFAVVTLIGVYSTRTASVKVPVHVYLDVAVKSRGNPTLLCRYTTLNTTPYESKWDFEVNLEVATDQHFSYIPVGAEIYCMLSTTKKLGTKTSGGSLTELRKQIKARWKLGAYSFTEATCETLDKNTDTERLDGPVVDVTYVYQENQLPADLRHTVESLNEFVCEAVPSPI